MVAQQEYEMAVEIARQNFDSIMRTMPSSLKSREDSLYGKLMNSKLGPIKRLEVLYKEMEIIYTFIHPFSLCKKGCNYCCHYEIAVSSVEVEYIKKNVNMKGKIKPERSKACPFLKKGICSIYPYRPFLCRRHLSLADSNRWCEKKLCNNYTFPLINFSEVDRSYADIAGLNGLNSVKDIRDVFPRA